MNGVISRSEVADVMVQALSASEAAFKTFELRKSEAEDAQKRTMTEKDYLRMFLNLSLGECQ